MDFELNSLDYFGGPSRISDYDVHKIINDLLKKLKIKRNCDVLELYLPKHNIVNVPSLHQFRNLTRLWLHKNRIQKLDFMQKNERLAEIYLQHNLIQDIDNCFRNLKYIRVLFLHGNQLSNLENVLKELSYLQFLENLNLFDNPIALETNYRPKTIHSIKHLKCLDRLMITDKERKKAFRMYEKKQIEIHSRYAFMKSFERSNQNMTPLGRRSLSRDVLKTPIIEDYEHYDLGPHKHETRELSYFDWTKVNLYVNRYKEHEEQQIVEVPGKKPGDITKVLELPQIITFRF